MKTITVRGIDDSLGQALDRAAEQEAKSINQLVLDILKVHFGQNKAPHFTRRHHDLDDLFGSWGEADYQQVVESVAAQRQIDPDIWA